MNITNASPLQTRPAQECQCDIPGSYTASSAWVGTCVDYWATAAAYDELSRLCKHRGLSRDILVLSDLP